MTNKNELSIGSHKLVDAICDFRISEKCRIKWKAEYREVFRSKAKHEGKQICLYCARTQQSGRNNSNCKYKKMDDDFFANIDTPEKAYVLGWIASDGCVSTGNEVVIQIHKKDEQILHVLRSIVCEESKISHAEDKCCLKFYSKKMCEDIFNLLSINVGKKSKIVQFPELKTQELKWRFLRGMFDGDGNIRKIGADRRGLSCSIASTSQEMKKAIQNFCNIPCVINEKGVEWHGINALDFLGKIYDNAEENLYLNRKRNLYYDWGNWMPTLIGKGCTGKEGLFCWGKTDEKAVPPSKNRVSDSGWDLTIIRKIKEYGPVVFYGTGIKVCPAHGWYFQLYSRSSLAKTGHILMNGVGVIDRGYNAEIIVPLFKVDNNAPDIELPARVVQIVPSPIIHAEFIQVDSFEETDRSGKGFGSSG